MRGGIQIDVVTPAESYELIDLTTLKTLLNITDGSLDDYFNLAIPEASTTVSDYCNQPFVIEAIQSSYWPTRDGWPWVVRGEISPLQLPRWPLTVVSSVVETIAGVPTTLVAGTDYIADMAKGQLVRLGQNLYPRNWHANPIVVNFGAGYSLVPGSVVSQVAEVIKGMVYARSRDPRLRSETVDQVYSATYWFGSGPDSTGGLPTSIAGQLDKYRMPVFA